MDRYVSAGGNFIDTSGNYAFGVNGTQGLSFPVPGPRRGFSAVRAVAAQTGLRSTRWCWRGRWAGVIPVIPLVGASSVAQLEESLAAVDLELSAEQRERLDQAR